MMQNPLQSAERAYLVLALQLGVPGHCMVGDPGSDGIHLQSPGYVWPVDCEVGSYL